MVLLANPEIALEVVVKPVKSTRFVVNVFDVETCKLYVVAAVAAVQLNVGAVDTLVAALAGEESDGTLGAGNDGTVPKLICNKLFTVPAGKPVILPTAENCFNAVSTCAGVDPGAYSK
jgi:hypothetical protein